MNHDLILLLFGLATIPAFTLQERPGIRAILALLFLLAALLSRKRVRVIPSLLFFVGIVFVHLITPTGRVIFDLAGFPITEGSIMIGADKGLLIIGLVFLSRYAVRSKALTKLRAESLLGETFTCFEALSEAFVRARERDPEAFNQRRRIRTKLIDWIDDLLISIYQERSAHTGVADSVGTQAAELSDLGETRLVDRSGFAIALFVVAWGSFVVGRFWPF